MNRPTHWLLLRGLSRDSRHWAGFDRQLIEAFPDTRVLTHDLPGNGRRWCQSSPLTLDGYAEDLLRHRQTLPATWRIAVFGLSLGGMVALKAGCDQPDAFSQVIAANASAIRVTPFWRRLRCDNIIRQLLCHRPGRSIEQAILALTSQLHDKDPELLQQWQEFRSAHHCQWANLLRQLWAALHFQLPAPPASLPILVLASRQDQLVNPLSSVALAKRLGCTLAWVDNAGHDLTLDQPGQTIVQIGLWLNHLPQERQPNYR